AIARVRGLDLSYLPKKLQSRLSSSLDKSAATEGLLQAIQSTEAAVSTAKPAYSPMHRQVRGVESGIRDIDEEIQQVRSAIRRLRGSDDKSQARRDLLQAQIDEMKAEQERLKATIPANWPEENKTFKALFNAEIKARRDYRRNVDGAYEPAKELLEALAGADELAALEQEIMLLQTEIVREPPRKAADRVREVSRQIGTVPGTSAIRSQLSKVRRELRRRTPNDAKVQEFYAKALQAYREDLAWRKRGSKELLPDLQVYETTIRDTIGLRQQPRLPREQALYIASCNSGHRDISLSF
ncbi:MAG: C4-dicarboxylate ABC transporter permease, partial [Hyphomicrobiaceae bacterium]